MARQNPFVDLAQAEMVSRLAAFWGVARAAHFFNAPSNWMGAGVSARRQPRIDAVRESLPLRGNGSCPGRILAHQASALRPTN